MSDSRPPYHRRRTKPLPRVESTRQTIPASPTAKAREQVTTVDEDDILTMHRCPLCCGQGMVSADVAVTFDGLIAKAKETA